MNVKKLSPVAEYLRANHAKAKNNNEYRALTGELVKTCEFYDPNGNYLGKMSRTGSLYSNKPSFAFFRSYIETLEPGYKAGYRQLKENIINFAKIINKKGEEIYLPEIMKKKQIVIDNQNNKTTDIFERRINSKLELLEAADKKAYGYVPQNTYKAVEPITYKEEQTTHTITKSDTF